jgi:hypothetical protein
MRSAHADLWGGVLPACSPAQRRELERLLRAGPGATLDSLEARQLERIAVYHFDFSLEYLEVPVLIKLSLPIRGARVLRPYLAAGPVYAWNLDCELTVEGDPQAAVEDCRRKLGDDARTALRNADRGLAMSGGIDLSVLGLGAVSLDARLVRGLARLTTGDGTQPDLRNQAFSLMLGDSFRR